MPITKKKKWVKTRKVYIGERVRQRRIIKGKAEYIEGTVMNIFASQFLFTDGEYSHFCLLSDKSEIWEVYR